MPQTLPNDKTEGTCEMDNALAIGTARTVHARLERGSALGSWTVHFESEALPGTLAAFAGVLTLEKLDITSAIIHKTDSRVTDSFDVRPLDGSTLTDDVVARLGREAADVMNGRLDLASRLSSVRFASISQDAPAAPTSVETMMDSEITTGVRVRTPDRPGLLYDLASTLARHGLRTRSLTALTFGGQAYDTFRVVDGRGEIVRDTAALDMLTHSLVRACKVGC